MKVFISDVDGVLTTGQFIYTADGKSSKIFGPDDNDGLSLLKGKEKLALQDEVFMKICNDLGWNFVP